MLQLQREQYIDTKKMLQALRYNNYVQTLQLQQLDGIRRNTEEAVDYLRNLHVQEIIITRITITIKIIFINLYR